MKILLEKYFSLHHDKVTHQVNSREINGDCYFYDNFSCQQCIPFFKRYCKHETFLLHTNSIVNAIEIEQFLNSFINLHNCERCDILLTDNHKIALIDMYCGMSEYLYDHTIEGKQAIGKKTKARRQIESTIKLLCEIPEINDALNNMTEKIGIFAYRAKDDELFANVPKIVSNSMDKFLIIGNQQAKRQLAAQMSNGFKYIMHHYPDRYQW